MFSIHAQNPGGREIDSYGKRAGKGPLIQTDLSGTLGVSQDQTLFASAFPIEGNGVRASHRGPGFGSDGDPSFTINTVEKHSVAVDIYNQTVNGETAVAITAHTGFPGHSGPKVMTYGISPYKSNSMLSDNPHSGIYEADTSRTLDNNGGNPSCNQGGVCVTYGTERCDDR